MIPSLYFWIARASLFVIPSPLPDTSAFALPCAEREYLFGFATACMIVTASAIFTTPSLLASPYFVGVTEGVLGVVVVVVVLVVVVVVLVVVLLVFVD